MMLGYGVPDDHRNFCLHVSHRVRILDEERIVIEVIGGIVLMSLLGEQLSGAAREVMEDTLQLSRYHHREMYRFDVLFLLEERFVLAEARLAGSDADDLVDFGREAKHFVERLFLERRSPVIYEVVVDDRILVNQGRNPDEERAVGRRRRRVHVAWECPRKGSPKIGSG